MKILVTGANGFIGKALCRELIVRGNSVVAMSRSGSFVEGCEEVKASFKDIEKYVHILQGVECVIHLAALAHQKIDKRIDSLSEFRSVNCEAALNLARKAATAGVRRFVFISSIGVNGSQTFGKPFAPSDVPNPQEPYAQSKWEAEQGLQRLAAETELELVIIRPPLVYGPQAPGNFGRLIAAVQSRKWLPLGDVHNCRTLVSLDNLVSLIATCIDHPSAAGQVFLAGDAEDTSTTDLLRRLGFAMGKPARLLPVPVGWMVAAAGLIGKAALVQKICGDLQVDISKNRELLGWQPPVSLNEGLCRAVQEKR